MKTPCLDHIIKTIFLVVLFHSLAASQESNFHRSLLNNSHNTQERIIPMSGQYKFQHTYLLPLRTSDNSVHFLLKSTKSESQTVDSLNSKKILFTAIGSSFLFGVFGAFIGYHPSKACPDGEIISDCNGNRAKIGLSMGSFTGSMFAYLAHRKKLKQKRPMLKAFAGNIIGAVAGYYLVDKTFGMSAIFFPTVTAHILLNGT